MDRPILRSKYHRILFQLFYSQDKVCKNFMNFETLKNIWLKISYNFWEILETILSSISYNRSYLINNRIFNILLAYSSILVA